MQKQFDSTKTVFLIDGSSFLYRAYYGMRPLHTSSGLTVQAVYVFCRMIKKLINTFEPKKMVLVWDSKGKTERHELFQEYKAGRQAPPSDLFLQKDLIVKFADIIGLAQSARVGVEADDIINSLVQDFKKLKYDVVVISSDKDLYQLIDEKVFVYDAFKEELADRQNFEQKMGFSVEKLPFYFALLGDASDNIPGVKGIGKTGATELVKQFENLEGLYSNIQKVAKDRAKNALLQNKENAFLSYELFKLRYHGMNIADDKIAFDANRWKEARPLFDELEFRSLVKEIDLAPEQSVHDHKEIEEKPFFADEKSYDFRCIQTTQQLNELCDYLKIKKSFAMDTETTGLSPLNDELIGISFCAELGIAYYVPFGHKSGQAQISIIESANNKIEQLSKQEVLDALRPILEDKNYKKYLHNANFDALFLHSNGINLKGVSFDTLIAASLVIEDGKSLGLKALSERFLNERMLTFEETVKDKKLKNFSYVPLADATKYAAGDSHQTFALQAIFARKLEEYNLTELFNKIEMPLYDILLDMENEGIFVDREILKTISTQLAVEIKHLENRIHEISESEDRVNLNSPKQIEELLFGKLNLPKQKKSGKGKSFSTDQEVLEELIQFHEIPKLLLRYRELYKLKSTYVDALPDYINEKTGNVHTTFSQTVASTGRLSSFNPNLQNIPIDGFGIRAAFKPEKGHVFLSADYSQIELRILAYFSRDQNLLNAFLKGEDVHAQTAAYLFDITLEDVTQEQRRIGKRINFSILYGLTPFGLSKDLKIPFKDAKIYIDKYFARYPGVLGWMESVIKTAKEKGYVETLLGRRRYVPGIYENNRILYDIAKRIAINSPAQGTAADILKLSMIELEKAFKARGLKAKIILQIHDELLISVPQENIAEVEKLTKDVLENIVKWDIPLVVTTRIGHNWQEVTK